MIVSELTSGGEDEVLETASTFYIQGFWDKKIKVAKREVVQNIFESS